MGGGGPAYALEQPEPGGEPRTYNRNSTQVPSLFADGCEEAVNALNADLTKAHYDMNKVNRNFFLAEHVEPEDVEALVRRPR
jgi:hypothetical protein